MRYGFIISISFLSLLGCSKKTKSQQDKSGLTTWYLAMEKTECFGTCPVYKMEVNSEGVLHLNARKFIEKKGKFTSTLSEDDLQEINILRQGANWKSYKSEYMTGMSDLPTTILSYSSHTGDTVRIRYESDVAPQELMNVTEKLMKVYTESTWTSTILK